MRYRKKGRHPPRKGEISILQWINCQEAKSWFIMVEESNDRYWASSANRRPTPPPNLWCPLILCIERSSRSQSGPHPHCQDLLYAVRVLRHSADGIGSPAVRVAKEYLSSTAVRWHSRLTKIPGTDVDGWIRGIVKLTPLYVHDSTGNG